MSTHYGRMVHQDDRTIMFANPEDAAEYLGFDLVANKTAVRATAEHAPSRHTAGGANVREGRREVLRRRQPHALLGRQPRTNWVEGAEQYAKGWIECFHAYMGLGPPETHWPLEQVPEVLRGRPR